MLSEGDRARIEEEEELRFQIRRKRRIKTFVPWAVLAAICGFAVFGFVLIGMRSADEGGRVGTAVTFSGRVNLSSTDWKEGLGRIQIRARNELVTCVYSPIPEVKQGEIVKVSGRLRYWNAAGEHGEIRPCVILERE